MPSHPFADGPAVPPSAHGPAGALDALISQTRSLRGGVDAVRREAAVDDGDRMTDPHARWQRALVELAARHLDDLGSRLDQLRDGLPGEGGPAPAGQAAPAPPRPSEVPGRVGSAEWDFLTDEVQWSPELYAIFGRTVEEGPLSLDELPTWLLPDDQLWMMEAVTDCLVDGKPIDGEFRILRDDGSVRTLHMQGEPVLDGGGRTASMWAVLRDVSALRRSERTARESRDLVRQQRHLAHTERRLAVELQEAVLPPWRGAQRLTGPGLPAGGLELAAHYLPSASSALVGGTWYDALELPDGATLLTVGDLTGHGVEATSGMAMLLGAVRGMALAGLGPGALMGHLNQLLDGAAQPALGSAVCCRYEPDGHTLTWAQAGHPAPLLYRAGEGRRLPPPEGVLLGATTGAAYGQHTEHLAPGDLLVLHTDGLVTRDGRVPPDVPPGTEPLLRLAPRFAAARTAQECVRAVVEEFGEADREDDACALVARVRASV
ncbi:SpoIIE family protein phosphatase [Streptomyces sp. TRM 70351]|uniref:PP2C family protein-serine/threonine phosphatase n=1 Tax=Streptomyces sp. TRM 70351 TaxID=3116552 RepID=UPI002E7B5C00|nr:SpoIIE family protein phosphatase [Streptomyces sp. TRM 70351]MEE1927286.1 SpoIIE family protein phosphatase [Streptomyces sp. TRM 70351]